MGLLDAYKKFSF